MSGIARRGDALAIAEGLIQRADALTGRASSPAAGGAARAAVLVVDLRIDASAAAENLRIGANARAVGARRCATTDIAARAAVVVVPFDVDASVAALRELSFANAVARGAIGICLARMIARAAVGIFDLRIETQAVAERLSGWASAHAGTADLTGSTCVAATAAAIGVGL
jgi:hypothetical protein